MSKVEKRTANLCMLYIIYIFLYGIVVKLTIWNSFLFTFKTYIPEILLLCIVLNACLQRTFILRKSSIALMLYLLVVFIINCLLYGISEQTFYCLRDIYIPMITFCVLKEMSISKNTRQKFYHRVVLFFKLYLIAGLILAVVQQLKGWEWASAFYTGYSFYGQDPISKVKIAHNFGLLRAPSLSGNFATFGYYCLIAAVFVDAYSDKLYKRIFWCVVAMACMVLATNKSAIVAFAVLIVFRVAGNIIKKSTIVNRVVIVLLVAVVGLSTFVLMGDNNDGTGLLTGLFERFDVWMSIFEETSVLEILFPYKMFIYGSGVEGNLGFWDNTYLYCLFAQGIIGTILWIINIRSAYKKQMLKKDKPTYNYVHELTIGLIILCLTVNVTQGRGYLSPYLLLLAFGAGGQGLTLKNQFKKAQQDKLNEYLKCDYVDTCE